MTDEQAQSDAEPQDVLTTVRKRIELVINEIADAELIAMLKTAMSELDLALAQSDAEPEAAEEIRRLTRENDILKLGAEAWPEILRDRDERLAALAQSDAEPVADEDAVNAAFDKWAETQGYGRMGNRLSFHAGVEFGLRHANCALAQSDAEPVAWKPDANMRVEPEMVARAMLKEIMKQIDYIETEGHIEWHKRIHVNGELYLPDISAAVLASLYTAPPRPDASAGLIEAETVIRAMVEACEDQDADGVITIARTYFARAAERSGK